MSKKLKIRKNQNNVMSSDIKRAYMRTFFRIFNYPLNYKTRQDRNPVGQVCGFFFIIFGVPLLNILIRAIYKFALNSEWGAPKPQLKEILLLDLFLLFEFLTALYFFYTLKNNFLGFYMKFYPSIKFSVFIISLLFFLIVYSMETYSGYSSPNPVLLLTVLEMSTYFILFFLPLKQELADMASI